MGPAKLRMASPALNLTELNETVGADPNDDGSEEVLALLKAHLTLKVVPIFGNFASEPKLALRSRLREAFPVTLASTMLENDVADIISDMRSLLSPDGSLMLTAIEQAKRVGSEILSVAVTWRNPSFPTALKLGMVAMRLNLSSSAALVST